MQLGTDLLHSDPQREETRDKRTLEKSDSGEMVCTWILIMSCARMGRVENTEKVGLDRKWLNRDAVHVTEEEKTDGSTEAKGKDIGIQ